MSRDSFKKTDVTSVKNEVRKAEKTMYRNDSEFVKFAKVDDGRNIFRVLPSKTGRAYIPMKTAKLKVYQEIKDKDGTPTGKYEWKDKNVFTSDIHGGPEFQGRDLLCTYISFVDSKADEIQDKEERDRYLYPINGYRKGSKWVWGIKPTLNNVCYVLQGNDICKLQLAPKQIKDMTDISIDLTDGEGLSMDVFSDPDEGYPLCLNKQKDDKGKTTVKVSAVQMTRSHTNLQEFFDENRIPDAVLDKLSKLPTLEEDYENVYTKREFDWTLEALREFDRVNKYDVFEDPEFLNAVEEIEKICPEYKPRNSSSDKEEKKTTSRSAGRNKDASDAGSNYPTPMKMRRFIMDYIANEYGDDYEMPEGLSQEELKQWYDLAKEEKALPFDEDGTDGFGNKVPY